VYRVPPGGGAAEVYASGFTAIADILFGPDGSLYVLEIAAHGLLAAFNGGDWTGALIRVMPDGTRTEIAAGALVAPGGVATSGDDVHLSETVAPEGLQATVAPKIRLERMLR
jgi:hypothetical protein